MAQVALAVVGDDNHTVRFELVESIPDLLEARLGVVRRRQGSEETNLIGMGIRRFCRVLVDFPADGSDICGVFDVGMDGMRKRYDCRTNAYFLDGT